MDIDERDSALQACSQGQAMYSLSAARALEDDYLCGCSAPSAIDCTDGRRRPDGRGDVPRLRASIPVSNSPARRHCYPRQSEQSQSVSRCGDDPSRGCLPALSAPYSHDFNPIEKFFSKLKALLRKAAKRSIDALWKEIGDLLNTVTQEECSNLFASCGYVTT